MQLTQACRGQKIGKPVGIQNSAWHFLQSAPVVSSIVIFVVVCVLCMTMIQIWVTRKSQLYLHNTLYRTMHLCVCAWAAGLAILHKFSWFQAIWRLSNRLSTKIVHLYHNSCVEINFFFKTDSEVERNSWGSPALYYRQALHVKVLLSKAVSLFIKYQKL